MDAARTSTSGPTVEVSVEHMADVDAWRVTYSLPEQVRGLRFLVPERVSRLSHWKFSEPDGIELLEAALPNDGKGERLIRSDGASFARVVVEITPDTEIPEKAYTPSIRYADRGILFFTGQLNVLPCVDGTGCARTSDVQTRFAFVPRAGERVVISGGDASVPARWAGPDQGTYVYFGALVPIETQFVTAVVDRGFPKWLRTSIDDLLPKVFAYYAKRTGYALNTRPLVFVSYSDEPRPGSRSIGGGTLPGIIQFDVRLGASFRTQNDPALADDIAHNVAHEAAHWWNRRMFANDSEERGGSWLHEGGADAFADRALRDLGVYSREKYHAQLSEALSLCVLGLRGAPLTTSSRRGRTKNWYWCGSAIALWTEAATSQIEPKEDLFGFWKRLFDAAPGRRYDDALYYRVLAARAPEAAAKIRGSLKIP